MFVVERLEAIQYDGTNGSFIADEWLQGATVGSDNGQTLVISSSAGNSSVQVSDWVVSHVDWLSEWLVYTDAVFDIKYQQA